MQPLPNATSAGVTLSFNMLSLVVSVHGAVGEDDSNSMRIVCTHEHAPTPVRQRMACPVCDNGDIGSFARAKQVGDGYVVIPQDILDAAKTDAGQHKKSISLTAHPASEVSSVLMPSGKSYYLSIKSPTKDTLDMYTLFARLIGDHPDKAFMCKFTLRSATSLFQLVVAGEGTLVLRQMADAALVREHPAITFSELDPRTLELAGMVADHQVQPFLIATHGTGKSQIIAEYAATQTPQAPVEVAGVTPVTAGATVLDLTAALEAMLAPAKPTRKRPARKAS